MDGRQQLADVMTILANKAVDTELMNTQVFPPVVTAIGTIMSINDMDAGAAFLSGYLLRDMVEREEVAL